MSNGTVTAVAAGTATITVKDSRSEKTATCKVTVKAAATTKSTATTTSSTSSAASPTTPASSSNASTNTDVWSGIGKDTSMKGNIRLDTVNSIVDRMKYLGYASDKTARTQLWKNLKGSGDYSGTAAQNVWMLSKLKSIGYKNGGVIDTYAPADMLSFLGDAIIRNGDSGIITVNPGESVMTEDFTKLVNPSVHAMTAFTKVYDDIIGSSQRYATNNTVNSNPVVNVDIVVQGNADANTVRDLNKFGKALANNSNFVNTMTRKISTNIAQDANKAGIVR